MATIKDVARKAGVAISTVSAVLNRSAPVSDAMIDRVERAVKATGYLPHGAARSLRSGQSRLIGLVVPDITNGHFAQVAAVIENECFDAGFMSFVYSTNENAVRETQILRMLRSQRVAGLIHIPTRSDAAHGKLLAKSIDMPTVLLDSQVDGLLYNSVALDNHRAAHQAAEHLLELGHRDIAIIAGRQGVTTGDERLAGTRDAFVKAGIPFNSERVIMAEFLQEPARAGVAAMFSARPRPTAIVAHSSFMMIGAIAALRQIGVHWPADVSLICVGDFEAARLVEPALTVMDLPVQDMARAAFRTLLGEIGGEDRPMGIRTNYPPRLLVRASCGPVPLVTR